MKKRFEYWSTDGKKWSDWFETNGEKTEWQMKNTLKNEYQS